MEIKDGIKKITFAWWNTSLSPHSKENQASEEHKNYVIYTLLRLIQEKSVDVLCLCEVSENDIEFIRELFLDTNFSIYDGAIRDGKKKFDLCIIYKASILTLIESEVISKLQVTRKIHAGQEVDFIINETQEPLTLYLVHWSSRMYDYEESPKKILLGSLLRDAVTSSIENRHIKNIIILGDFNEEPFNKSLTDALYASRDISLVKKTPGLLYNPFWRHMVYHNLHPYSHQYEGCGTYYYKGDESNHWKTFDQIIFSSSFVRGEQWFLNEAKTEIFYDEEFIKFIYSSKSKFDHLPVISSIERI
jgi:hypothetical protein